MYVQPSNPIIKKSLTDFLTKDLGFAEQIYDYDGASYMISSVEKSDKVRFSIKTGCKEQLFKNGAMQMLEEEYKDYIIPEAEYDEGFDLTLSIDTGALPKTKKV